MVVDLPAGTGANSWYIGNIKRSGWYRVNYDANNWNFLIAQLNQDHNLIDPIHRAQLLDDSFNLGRAEVVPQTRFLDITVYLVKELDPVAFVPAFDGFSYMTVQVEDEPQSFDLYKVSILLNNTSGCFCPNFKMYLIIYQKCKNFLKRYYMGLLLTTYNRIGWSLNLDDANEM